MSSTFTPNLNLELQGTGDNSGTWGAELNTAVFTIIDAVLGGVQTISLSSINVTLNTAQSQNNFIKLTGALTGNVSVIFPAIGRAYFIKNSTTGAFTVTLKIGSSTGVVCPQGTVQPYLLDGSDVSVGQNYASPTFTGTVTVPDNSFANAKLATEAQATIKGRAAGAGTGNVTDLTGTQVAAIVDAFTGDAGGGGVKGEVPAPAAGDAAANKLLGAAGGWVAPVNQVYSGTSVTNTVFPIGTTVTVFSSTNLDRNSYQTVYLNGSFGYVLTSGTALSGTWASRGTANSIYVFQRVA